MGYMTTTLGIDKKDIKRFVITPFYNEDLRTEARIHWEPHKVWRTSASELADDIKDPANTVLYVLAHSGRNVSYIAGDKDEKMSAKELVDYLIDHDLPTKIRVIKIWACFSGVNGFAQQVKDEFQQAKKGYNPVVMGYSEATGGFDDVEGDPHKHVFEITQEGGRGALIGRASLHRVICS